MGTMPGEIRLDKINRMNEIDAFMDTGTEGWAYYAPPEDDGSGGGGYGGYSYPSYGGYNYPSYDYPEQAQNWYENMLQWKID
jgi:hypothetical protein